MLEERHYPEGDVLPEDRKEGHGGHDDAEGDAVGREHARHEVVAEAGDPLLVASLEGMPDISE